MCGFTAGGIGAAVGNPADLILIRMQTDGTLPEAKRRNYKSFGNAVTRIISEEGFFSLWKGGTPTVVRAMVSNVGMFATYEEAKERLYKLLPNNTTIAWLIATFLSGTICAVSALPFDNAKTKL